MKVIICVVLSIALMGCEPTNKKVDDIDVGVVVDVEFLPSDWDYDVSTIVTDKGEFKMYGAVSFIRGEKANVRFYENNDRYICLENDPICYKLLQRNNMTKGESQECRT